jgi:ADP-ribosylarginine hydrolase
LPVITSYNKPSSSVFHSLGYLGSVAAALLTAYSIQRKPMESWGAGLISTLPKVWAYITKVNRDVQENKNAWDYFTGKWTAYLKLREITDGTSQPKFPKKYGIPERDAYYKSVSFSGWGGASGHDAPMIAYDALLRAGESWYELCSGSMFHGGDSDSTGVMAAAWWGGLYGMKGVPPCNYNKLEYRKKLEKLADALLKAAKSRRGK